VRHGYGFWKEKEPHWGAALPKGGSLCSERTRLSPKLDFYLDLSFGILMKEEVK